MCLRDHHSCSAGTSGCQIHISTVDSFQMSESSFLNILNMRFGSCGVGWLQRVTWLLSPRWFLGEYIGAWDNINLGHIELQVVHDTICVTSSSSSVQWIRPACHVNLSKIRCLQLLCTVWSFTTKFNYVRRSSWLKPRGFKRGMWLLHAWKFFLLYRFVEGLPGCESICDASRRIGSCRHQAQD